jgi:tetratricopeptide (TPR) repeat protein
MAKIRLAEAKVSFELLLKQQQYSGAVDILGRAMPEFGDPKGLAEMLGLLERIPEAYRCSDARAALLYAKTLRVSGAGQATVAWGSRVATTLGEAAAVVQVEAAGALNGLKRYAEARALLEGAIPLVSGEALGLAWSRLGYALFNLGEPPQTWRGAFDSARVLLKGEELGRMLINAGYCCTLAGWLTEAQSAYLEALAAFRHNPYFQALARYNLGMNALRELQPDTERHFLEAVRLTHDPRATALRPAVLNGLGAYRRALGEWSRAETAYREALRLPPSSNEREISYFGLARTQCLAGRAMDALETLEVAKQEPTLEPQMIYLAQALASLALGQVDRAKVALAKTGSAPSEILHWLWQIARAELARLEGRPQEAVALLEDLPLHTLHAREEVRQWPALFELVHGAGKEVPQPLEYPPQTVVQVQALGMLRVSVNGRPVPLAPLGRAAELFGMLLHQGERVPTEKLVDMLWPGSTVATKRQALWQLVKEVRGALGWTDSVQSVRKGYELDSRVIWDYDVAQARAAGKVKGVFLDGLYSDWVLGVNEELEAYRDTSA